MELDISPEPTEAERAAIVAALERIDGDVDSGRGAWWQAGVRENLEDEPEGENA